MTRRQDWEGRLADAFRDAAFEAYAWGRHDCWTFVADCIQAIAGVDPMATWRGRYNSPRSAARLLRRQYGTAERFWNGAAGLRPCDVMHAGRGDAVLLPQSCIAMTPPAIGIIGLCGYRVYHIGPDGLEFELLQRDQVDAAWRVG